MTSRPNPRHSTDTREALSTLNPDPYRWHAYGLWRLWRPKRFIVDPSPQHIC